MIKNLRLTILSLLAFISTAALANEYRHVFDAATLNGDGVVELSDVNWEIIATGAGYWGYQETKGQQIGSANKPAKTITLSTSDIKGSVSKIIVNTSGAKGIDATLSVTVGNTTFGTAYKLTDSPSSASFTDNASGKITLLFQQQSSKAIYIKSIQIVYSEGGGTINPPVEEKIAKVNSIAEFVALPNGKEGTLYLSNDMNARVTYVHGSTAYLRDKTGAICFYQFDKTPTMAYNDHVVGYITGKKMMVGNMPVMVATDKTNTNLLAIAKPVTELNVEPTVIKAADWSKHYADWVTIKDVKMQDANMGNDGTGNVNVVNTFNITPIDALEASCTYNLSGIANATTNGIDELSLVYNEASARQGNPSADVAAKFSPISKVTTGIGALVNNKQGHAIIYDITGRRVSPAKMSKGIYIFNGKKYIK